MERTILRDGSSTFRPTLIEYADLLIPEPKAPNLASLGSVPVRVRASALTVNQTLDPPVTMLLNAPSVIFILHSRSEVTDFQALIERVFAPTYRWTSNSTVLLVCSSLDAELQLLVESVSRAFNLSITGIIARLTDYKTIWATTVKALDTNAKYPSARATLPTAERSYREMELHLAELLQSVDGSVSSALVNIEAEKLFFQLRASPH